MSRLLSILDPFSGPATFALEETAMIPPQHAPRSSANRARRRLPDPRRLSLRKRSGRRAQTRPVPWLGLREQARPARTACRGPRWRARPPSARDSGVAAGRARVGTGQGRKIPRHPH